MQIYEVTPLGAPINFQPSTEAEEILQNVATIIATVRYSVPFDRMFGINPEYLDDPIPIAEVKSVADIIEAIHRHEPRCRVESVTFDGDGSEGIMRPKVRVYING